MTEKKPTLKRQIITAGGWQIAKRAAKSVPYLGTAVAIGLIGQSIKRKGVVNSGLDAIPFVGTAKNVVEFFTGDLIPDKNDVRRPK